MTFSYRRSCRRLELSRRCLAAVCTGAMLLPVASPAAFAATALPAAQATQATGNVSVPRLDYRKRVLPNGLTVLSVENHQSPTVAVQVWYRVGGKDDPQGRSGFAHLFEHIMFKSTRNMKTEQFDRLTEDVGGENNAYTAEDRTVYHETVPSNYLETILWAESDRLANLTVDEANFQSERAVVQEEYRQSILAPPYGRLGLLTNKNSFTTHPYRRDVIGSIADLDAATVADVQKFHSTYYRPDNATLVVAGDFDSKQLDAWVDKYFGRIARPSGDIPRVTVQEPARTGGKRFEETGPNVPLPAVVINYLVPPVTSDDAQAMRVAEVILSRGDSSRLNQSLVYRQQIAAQADASADLRQDAGLFQFTTIAAGGKSLADVEKATVAEIEKLRTTPVSQSEIDKARNILLSNALDTRETSDGLAAALGNAAVTLGDQERVNTDIARLQAVTPADIQRIAQKYFTPENQVVITYQNGTGEQGGASSNAAPREAAPTAVTPQEQPPAPASPRTVNLPTPVEKKLANGLRVIVVPRPGSGLVSVVAAVKAGGAREQNERAGLADFTASLLTRGTTTRSATEIAETVEALGGSIGSGAGWDSATVSLSSLAARLEQTLPVMADVLRNPAFKEDEVERLRAENMDGLSVSLRSPGTLARYAAARVVWGDTAYGHSLNGTPETLKNLGVAPVRRFYGEYFRPNNTTLVVSGDITPQEAFSRAESAFGDWKGPNVPMTREMLVPAPAPKAQKGGRVVVIDKPDAGQAAVLLVRPGIRRADKEYLVGQVANSVLGGGYSARLNYEIRIKRGLSYGANSGLDSRVAAGQFTAAAQTANPNVPQVASLVQSELSRLATSDVPQPELVTRKAALSGNYARGLETGAGLAGAVALLATYDLPLSRLSEYLPGVQAVTGTQVKQFAATTLKPAEASIVIVGDGRQFLTELKRRFPQTEVIPVDKLDLNKAGLKKP